MIARRFLRNVKPGYSRRAAGMLLCGLLLVACGAQPVATEDTTPEPTGAARATVQAMQTAIATVTLPADTAGPVVPLSNIDDFPEQYAGEPVTVRGIVVSLIGAAAFQITDMPLLSSDTLLVVAADGTADVAEGDILLVRGRVRHLDPQDMPEEIDPGFLNDIFPAFDGDTVMIAQSITQLSSDALDE
ncbi:MAG: hypothetical protein ACLFVO_07585 [Chloroflexaceae bacterium]